jgi:hypothetical protein
MANTVMYRRMVNVSGPHLERPLLNDERKVTLTWPCMFTIRLDAIEICLGTIL